LVEHGDHTGDDGGVGDDGHHIVNEVLLSFDCRVLVSLSKVTVSAAEVHGQKTHCHSG